MIALNCFILFILRRTKDALSPMSFLNNSCSSVGKNGVSYLYFYLQGCILCKQGFMLSAQVLIL